MNILEEIAKKTKDRVEEQKRKISLEEMEKKARCRLKEDPRTHRFFDALNGPELAFICEVKKASPSKGIIAKDFPWLAIALDYETAGAAAISCLTEPFWFLGRNDYLKGIAAAVSIPVLRKDFTVDPYMIYEAKALGAGAVLLICAILDDACLKDGIQLANELGMDALVEAHTPEEVLRSAKAGAKIVGVNNRNLKDFSVNLENSRRLKDLAPENTLFVSESGIKTAEDVKALKLNGTDAVLIGETLMRAKNKKKMLDYLAGRSSAYDPD